MRYASGFSIPIKEKGNLVLSGTSSDGGRQVDQCSCNETLPMGRVSKNSIGTRRTEANMRLWRFFEEVMHIRKKRIVRIKATVKSTKVIP